MSFLEGTALKLKRREKWRISEEERMYGDIAMSGEVRIPHSLQLPGSLFTFPAYVALFFSVYAVFYYLFR